MRSLDYIFSFPGMIAAKSNDSRYLALSPVIAAMVGLKNPESSIGKNDYDFDCSVAKVANKIIELDQQTFSTGKKLISVETHHYKDGWKTLLAERNPIKNNISATTTLITHSIDVTNTNLSKCSILLSKIDKKTWDKQSIYILNDESNSLSLTDRQKTCLFLLVRGKTIKGIAVVLGISPKTVEEHIAIIKKKMNCFSKSELIEKAIDSGFLAHLPQDLLNDDFEKIIKH